MKRFYLFMLMFIAGIGVASADVDVRLNSGDNSSDQANVKCIAFTMPTEDVDGNTYTQAPLHNINLFIFIKSQFTLCNTLYIYKIIIHNFTKMFLHCIICKIHIKINIISNNHIISKKLVKISNHLVNSGCLF